MNAEFDLLSEDPNISEAIATLLGTREGYARQRDEALAAIARIDRALDALGVEPHEDRAPVNDVPADFDPREQDPDAYPGYVPDDASIGDIRRQLAGVPTRASDDDFGPRAPAKNPQRTIDYLREWIATLPTDHTAPDITPTLALEGCLKAGWTSNSRYPIAVVTSGLGQMVKAGELVRVIEGRYVTPEMEKARDAWH